MTGRTDRARRRPLVLLHVPLAATQLARLSGGLSVCQKTRAAGRHPAHGPRRDQVAKCVCPQRIVAPPLFPDTRPNLARVCAKHGTAPRFHAMLVAAAAALGVQGAPDAGPGSVPFRPVLSTGPRTLAPEPIVPLAIRLPAPAVTPNELEEVVSLAERGEV